MLDKHGNFYLTDNIFQKTDNSFGQRDVKTVFNS